MKFAPDRPRRDWQPHEARWLRLLLLAACLATAVTTAWPWLQAGILRVFAEPGFRSRTGFVCLMSCAMLCLLTAVETKSHHSRDAVRTASLFVAAVAAVLLAVDAWQGPEHLRGVPTSWTHWFWAAFAGITLVAAACVFRLPRRPRLDFGD